MNDCLFCKIINGEIPGQIVYKDDEIIAFKDINPKAPVHVLIVPVAHIESLRDAKEEHGRLLGRLFLKVNEIAKKMGIYQGGYKVVINNGKESGQLVYHLHIHLLGGWKKIPVWEV